jgi:hypothetical protein
MPNLDRVHIECPLTKEPIKFTLQATLVRAAANPKEQDHWSCVITSDYPGSMTLDYRMGVGHRKGYKQGRMSVYDWERTRPVAPNIRYVLASVGMDYQAAQDMPWDEADACDHMAAEGLADGTKPGDVLRMVRAIKAQADKLESLLKHTGIDAQHFADWAQGLDA